MNRGKVAALALVILFLAACGAKRPQSFLQVIQPTWASIELRDGLSKEQAWEDVLDVLSKKFELEMISKEGGYIRTAWVYTWWKAGELTENYRVRSIVKFSSREAKVEVKTEANFLDGDLWYVGTDTRLLQTIKTDIMGVVGRTTR